MEAIVEAVAKQKNVALDAKLIQAQTNIKEVGTYKIPLGITLGNGQRANLEVVVAS